MLSKDFSSLSIFSEEEDFFVVEKPCGLACHGPDAVNLVGLLKDQKLEPFLCHRLDKETSGLMLVAKSKTSANTFRELFLQNKIQKYYLAVSEKRGKKKQGTIKGEMKTTRSGSWGIEESSTPNAITQFFSFGNSNAASPARLFVIKIYGGKTHQIRVALKANGSPILGDQRYAATTSKKNPFVNNAAPLHLHAYKLMFNYAGKEYCFISKPKFLDFFPEQSDSVNINRPETLNWPTIKQIKH